jgi:hypothetical protein
MPAKGQKIAKVQPETKKNSGKRKGKQAEGKKAKSTRKVPKQIKTNAAKKPVEARDSSESLSDEEPRKPKNEDKEEMQTPLILTASLVCNSINRFT